MKFPLSKSGAKAGTVVTLGKHGPVPMTVSAVSPSGKVLTVTSRIGTFKAHYSARYDFYKFGAELLYVGGVR